MSTRAIRTSTAHAACDVCGRTLLRGERAETYLMGGTRRSVCELCTSRAVHGGWVREGQVPSYEESGRRPERRRSLLSRLRGRQEAFEGGRAGRERSAGGEAPSAVPEPDLEDGGELGPPPWEDESRGRSRRRGSARPQSPAWPAPGSRAAGGRGGVTPGRPAGQPREPRHVRAVPTSAEHRIASAVSLFNDSEHTRTVAGVARSLGPADVSVAPSAANASVVVLVVSWELCWYRYEADLSDEVPRVRVVGQGYELSELSDEERSPNAGADEHGRLALGR
ncbi:MAG: hypothetical protein ACRDMJ_06530 [Solirubrobacteraceae bacterium]